MTPHPKFQDALNLMQVQMGSLQREFGHVVSGKKLIAESVSYPAHPEETKKIRDGVYGLLEGSLLVYLFAMWESHVPEDVSSWFTPEELIKLNAYKHVRDSVAHKYNGNRADFPQRRQAFESMFPFSGIVWNQQEDTIDLTNASVALDCHQYMEELTKKLVSRLYMDKKPALQTGSI